MRQLVPLPGEEEVAATALPSRRFPSDHLSLCCDFEWLLPSSARTAAGPTQRLAPSPSPALDSSVERGLQRDERGLQRDERGLQGDEGEDSRQARRYPARMRLRKKLPQPASPHLVYKGVSALGKGDVIAVPTDTVYGLAAAADSAAGVRRLYQVSAWSH